MLEFNEFYLSKINFSFYQWLLIFILKCTFQFGGNKSIYMCMAMYGFKTSIVFLFNLTMQN